jgi:hypothetical protein
MRKYIRDLLVRLAGADPTRFHGIEDDLDRWARLGALMLIPAFVGAVAVYSCSFWLGNSMPAALIKAAGYFGVLLLIEMMLVSTISRLLPHEPWHSQILPIVYRFSLALLVGIAVGAAGLLALVSGSVKERLEETTRERVLVATKPMQARLDALDQAIVGARHEEGESIAMGRSRLNEAVTRRTAEVQGIGGSLRYGHGGPGDRAAQAEVNHLRSELDALVAASRERIQDLVVRRTAIVREIANVRQEIEQHAAHDVLAYIRAFIAIMRGDRTLWPIGLFIMLLTIAIEISPLGGKYVVVRNSVYALRQRMLRFEEEEEHRVRYEALQRVHDRRVELLAEEMAIRAAWRNFVQQEEITREYPLHDEQSGQDHEHGPEPSSQTDDSTRTRSETQAATDVPTQS